MADFSIPHARRIALSAQGFATPRPTGITDRRHLKRVLDNIGLIQIDSVNVLVRSQELPLFARLGSHRRDLIPAAAAAGDLFEYWGHEASYIPVSMHPLFRWRMQAAHSGAAWSNVVQMQRERPGFVNDVLTFVSDNGPTVAADLKTRTGPKGTWWDWDHGKLALEWLFWTGQVTGRRRANDFARVYDLPERLIPQAILDLPTPSAVEAKKDLLVLAARHHGIATAADLCDYYRLKLIANRPLLIELVEEGRLQQVTVDGWAEPAYLHPNARIPRRVQARALLSPFDPVVWFRPRSERLFNFHYRIEIYTPAPKRTYGYYVLPFLLGDQVVARVDLKADRQASVLRAHGAFAEEGADPAAVAGPLADELRLMAEWLGLESVAVGTSGNLARPLARQF